MPGREATLWAEIATWTETLAVDEGLTSKTAAMYGQAVRRFAAWLRARRPAGTIAGLRAAGITSEDAAAYRDALVERALAGATINRHITALRLFVDRAGQVQPVPCDLALPTHVSLSYDWADSHGCRMSHPRPRKALCPVAPHSRAVRIFNGSGWHSATEPVSLDGGW